MFFFPGHPWIRNYNDIKLPLDILIFRLIKAYIRSSSLRKAALRVSNSNFSSDFYPFVLHAYVMFLLQFGNSHSLYVTVNLFS